MGWVGFRWVRRREASFSGLGGASEAPQKGCKGHPGGRFGGWRLKVCPACFFVAGPTQSLRPPNRMLWCGGRGGGGGAIVANMDTRTSHSERRSWIHQSDILKVTLQFKAWTPLSMLCVFFKDPPAEVVLNRWLGLKPQHLRKAGNDSIPPCKYHGFISFCGFRNHQWETRSMPVLR